MSDSVFVLLVVAIVAAAFWVLSLYGNSLSEETKYGKLNAALICPHCQTKGRVRTKWVDEAAGISGPKAIGAAATGGLSLLVTGISRKRQVTRAHCGNCTSTWTVG